MAFGINGANAFRRTHTAARYFLIAIVRWFRFGFRIYFPYNKYIELSKWHIDSVRVFLHSMSIHSGAWNNRNSGDIMREKKEICCRCKCYRNVPLKIEMTNSIALDYHYRRNGKAKIHSQFIPDKMDIRFNNLRQKPTNIEEPGLHSFIPFSLSISPLSSMSFSSRNGTFTFQLNELNGSNKIKLHFFSSFPVAFRFGAFKPPSETQPLLLIYLIESKMGNEVRPQ